MKSFELNFLQYNESNQAGLPLNGSTKKKKNKKDVGPSESKPKL